MGLEVFESFDRYGSGAGGSTLLGLVPGWSSNNMNPTADPRTGAYAMKSNGSPTQYVQHIFEAGAKQTRYYGFGFKTGGLGAKIIDFIDGGTVHCQLRSDASGNIEAWRGNGAAYLGETASPVLTTSTYYYIEVKVTIDDSAGEIVVRVNGTEVLNLTGKDTRNGGNASHDRVQFIGTAFSANECFDDVYVTDDGFIGDSGCEVHTLMPTGAGNSAQGTRGGADSGANWSQVEEVGPNGDTDYVEESTNGEKDTYALADLSTSHTHVKAVKAWAYAKLSAAGNRAIYNEIRTGGSDYDGNSKALSTSYDYYEHVWTQNPNTTADWTPSEVDGLEAGFEMASGSTSNARISQAGVDVLVYTDPGGGGGGPPGVGGGGLVTPNIPSIPTIPSIG